MISVFTPTHNTQFLQDCYNSLAQQNYTDWEWIVVPNGDVEVTWTGDERVRVVPAPEGMTGVGALKKFACEQAKGDILFELDHDDWLLPSALRDTAEAFANNPEASMVFSDCANITAEGEPSSERYYGRWNYTSEEAYGKLYHRCHSQAATPENVGVIWYAPNHLRAFPRWAYEQVGGYDPSLYILDDLDLMQKLFMVGPFHHIDKMLYFQRIHGQNTQVDLATNLEIQALCARMYKERIDDMTKAYVDRLIAAREIDT